ncbi:MAG: HlyD family secretion protein [Pseudomonadota bacterium]|nr:HlyD family secretion protein [Pseudomonadota bacterium]
MTDTTQTQVKKRRNFLRPALLIVVPLVALTVMLYIYVTGGRYVVTENAYVKSNVVTISSDVSGRVIAVTAEEHQSVRKGEVLFRLDAAPYEIDVHRADSEMALVATEIASLQSDFRETLIEADEARERVVFLERQLKRQGRLRKQGLGSEERYDEALYAVNAAKQQVALIEQRTKRVLAALGGDATLATERHPRYLRARATRDQAALDLARTVVLSPADGIISNMKLQSGEFVAAGKPVFSLVETATVWVEANLKETQLTHVREGQLASVVADAYPDQVWETKVANISPATGSEFALLPPQNASGNWVKVVQWVPLRLALDNSLAGRAKLRAGMTVTVRIDTARQRAAPRLIRRLFGEDDPVSIVHVASPSSRTTNRN